MDLNNWNIERVNRVCAQHTRFNLPSTNTSSEHRILTIMDEQVNNSLLSAGNT